MQPLRRWVPGTAKGAAQANPAAARVRPEDISLKDLAFCSELAFHGGVARNEEGFTAEAELLRMRQAGLLELQRTATPPFAVMQVNMSPRAYELLSRRVRGPASGSGTQVTAHAAGPVATPGQKRENILRRNGFEVARGMINAAVKSEIAAWTAEGQHGGAAALEARILTRVGQFEVPFPA